MGKGLNGKKTGPEPATGDSETEPYFFFVFVFLPSSFCNLCWTLLLYLLPISLQHYILKAMMSPSWHPWPNWRVAVWPEKWVTPVSSTGEEWVSPVMCWSADFTGKLGQKNTTNTEISFFKWSRFKTTLLVSSCYCMNHTALVLWHIALLEGVMFLW